mmetsp:Transcript_91432/g.263925  ORF Transcript_91432/g.263925 Transcript_91432/m.263925 type:complete len:185 (-) Transcript_91432:141-695(-)
MFDDDEVAVASDFAKIEALKRSISQRQAVYSYCAGYYSRRYHFMTILAATLAVAICILVSLWPFAEGGDIQVAGQIVVAFFSGLCTLMIACSALLGHDVKMAAFDAAAKQLESMGDRLQFLTGYRVGGPVLRCEIQRLISSIEDRMSDMNGHVPAVSGSLWMAGCKTEEQSLDFQKRQAAEKQA